MRQTNIKRGHNCVIASTAILDNVTCGDNVIVGDFVELKNVHIAAGSKIGSHVIMYSANPEIPILIGTDVWISHGVFAEATGGRIVIEDYAVIAHRSMLLTSSGPGKKSYLMDKVFPVECGDIHIKAHSWIGSNVVLLPNVLLHEGVVIGAHSLVKEGVYDSWMLYAGSPCKPIRKINKSNDGKEFAG